MKLSLVIFALVLIALVHGNGATVSPPQGGDDSASVSSNPDCVAACNQGRAAFCQWCNTQATNAQCHILCNAPPQIFSIQGCLRYCVTG